MLLDDITPKEYVMILNENNPEYIRLTKKSHRYFYHIVCDKCGVFFKRSPSYKSKIAEIRESGLQYCKSCTYAYRCTNQKTGKESPFYINGKSISDSGYWRINLGENKGKYEHKIIYEKYYGCKLKPHEKIHHIDGVKTNNAIENLFLCKNKSHHSMVHNQLENIGFLQFKKKIWFDYAQNIYILEQTEIPNINFDYSVIDPKKISKNRWNNGKIYLNYYLGNRIHVSLHRYIYELHVGHKIENKMHIHHIDGNTLCNNLENLVLLSASDHKKAHNSLQECVLQLYKFGDIDFDKNKGVYYVKE